MPPTRCFPLTKPSISRLTSMPRGLFLVVGACGMLAASNAYVAVVPLPLCRGRVCAATAHTRLQCCDAEGSAPRALPRRAVLAAAATATASCLAPSSATANTDKTMSKFGRQAPPTDKDSEPFQYLDSGVGWREYKSGKGEAEVEEGSRVTVNLVGRLLNLNGVKFFSTKETTDEFGEGTPLTFTVGAGEALPGLEQGMVGMKKGAVRKVRCLLCCNALLRPRLAPAGAPHCPRQADRLLALSPIRCWFPQNWDTLQETNCFHSREGGRGKDVQRWIRS